MRLKTAVVPYDRVAAIADGRVHPDGVEFDIERLAPSEIFFRMLKDEAFDVSEMSLSSTLIEMSRGRDWVVLPVFPFRSAFHTGFLVPEHITHPQDLRGGRIGLVEYQVTAALWGRGTLADDFGVDPTDVTWYVERSGELSHSGAGGFSPPEGVEILPIGPDTSMAEMLVAGELDAVLPSPMPRISNRFNRTDERRLLAQPGITRLFRDPMAEARRYYEHHGFLHINHVVVVRGELVRQRPELPRELMDTFIRAKGLAEEDRDRLRLSWLVLAHLHLEEQDEIFGPDPFPYGVSANVEALRTAIRRSVTDGFIGRPLELEELFAEGLLET